MAKTYRKIVARLLGAVEGALSVAAKRLTSLISGSVTCVTRECMGDRADGHNSQRKAVTLICCLPSFILIRHRTFV